MAALNAPDRLGEFIQRSVLVAQRAQGEITQLHTQQSPTVASPTPRTTRAQSDKDRNAECLSEAQERGLQGEDRRQFIIECQVGD